jgi:hypothetical protein
MSCTTAGSVTIFYSDHGPYHVSVSDDTPIVHERGEHTIPAAH